MTHTAIRVAGLGKQFHIAKLRRPSDTAWDALIDGLTGPLRRSWRAMTGKADSAAELDDTFWAFRDLSFEIRRGEVVGIIGRNGAGKSTLLKILSRITRPTEGHADICGRVGSLLEVGTGFHPELSGRENIFLNGAILGMRKAEIRNKLEAIIDFSEIGKFIDTPIKHYSSGMTMRLAFSVAAHLEPEIMIVDEVLAVGDQAFQNKCLGKMDEVSSQGRTVFFVSHNMAAVTQLCSRAIWLEEGRLRMDGPADDVVSAYLANGLDNHGVWVNGDFPDMTQEAWFDSARLLDSSTEAMTSVAFEEPFQLEINFRLHRAVPYLAILAQVTDARSDIVFESTDIDDSPHLHQVREAGSYRSVCNMPSHLLKPGRYHVTLWAYVHMNRTVDVKRNVLTFDITARGYRMSAPRRGAVTPVLKWDVMKLGVNREGPAMGNPARNFRTTP